MKVIITMAGKGQRFRDIGINKPKHEILARGKSLFRWSLESLSDYSDADYIFIVRKGAYDSSFLKQECATLGIKNYHLAEVDAPTDGQAGSAMLANNFIGEDEAVIIFNIDTHVDPEQIKKSQIPSDAEGFLHAFDAEGDKWSFVRSEANTNRVIEVSEKVRISNLGTIGLYYFRRWKQFTEIYQKHRDEIIAQYRESYIAPMYAYLIADEKPVYTIEIPKQSVHVLGTPDDLQAFDPNYLQQQ
jgi:dTDP-glucose pyrophosphorylase